ncbi:hypothetical protein [Phenylobacterium sp.]|uniref:hypothetical protein n=1 Tax=Phenylobacterium sp. TaxID=1871053 RepID=UPI00286AF06F|nr:hypothetical protein [Phenylobacterium sp.]
MKGQLYLSVLLSMLALGACGAGVDRLSKAADSARSATERMAASGEAASDAREARVLADAQDIQERAAARVAEENGGRPRYEIRKEGDSWTVYDTINHRAARVGPKLQSGMSHEKAEAAFNDLQNEEEQNAAAFAPGGPSRRSRR